MLCEVSCGQAGGPVEVLQSKPQLLGLQVCLLLAAFLLRAL